MALFKFTKAILNGDPIDVYNNGNMRRDFTYIDDLIDEVRLLIDQILKLMGDENKSDEDDSKSAVAPFRVVNIGNSKPEKLLDFIEAIEKALGLKAVKNFLPMQAGDVPETYADTSLLATLTGCKPHTEISEESKKFVEWYRDYFKF